MTFWELCAKRSDRNVVFRAQRRRIVAAYAQLNWRIETVQLIESEMRGFFSRGHGRWVLMPKRSAGTAVQVDLHTDQFLPEVLGSSILTREGPASLVYSLHPNGSVLVVASSHSSAHTSSDSQNYILDLVPHVWSLAGSAGRARVRCHLRAFGGLTVSTRAEALPSRASGRFLRKLADRSDRFAVVFQSASEARRHRLSQEANLGIGLIAGLIASTIWPFARDFGKEAGVRAAATRERCLEGFSSGPGLKACLQRNTYGQDDFVASLLSTGGLLVLALTLTFTALWILWRINRRR